MVWTSGASFTKAAQQKRNHHSDAKPCRQWDNTNNTHGDLIFSATFLAHCAVFQQTATENRRQQTGSGYGCYVTRPSREIPTRERVPLPTPKPHRIIPQAAWITNQKDNVFIQEQKNKKVFAKETQGLLCGAGIARIKRFLLHLYLPFIFQLSPGDTINRSHTHAHK